MTRNRSPSRYGVNRNRMLDILQRPCHALTSLSPEWDLPYQLCCGSVRLQTHAGSPCRAACTSCFHLDWLRETLTPSSRFGKPRESTSSKPVPKARVKMNVLVHLLDFYYQSAHFQFPLALTNSLSLTWPALQYAKSDS
jgi:hypothetical protein